MFSVHIFILYILLYSPRGQRNVDAKVNWEHSISVWCSRALSLFPFSLSLSFSISPCLSLSLQTLLLISERHLISHLLLSSKQQRMQSRVVSSTVIQSFKDFPREFGGFSDCLVTNQIKTLVLYVPCLIRN